MQWIVLILFCVQSIAFADADLNEDAVTLRWQLSPGEQVAYRLYSELTNVVADAKRPRLAKSSVFIVLTGQEDQSIRMDWIQGPVKMPSSGFSVQQRQAFDDIAAREDSIIFSGSIDAHGKLLGRAADARTGQMLTLIFQMPNNPLAEGTAWELPLTLLHLRGDDPEQRVVEQSSQVQLVELAGRGKRQVASVQYDLREHISYVTRPYNQRRNVSGLVDALGEFVVQEGRWKRLEGRIEHAMHNGGMQEHFVFSALPRVKKKWRQLLEQTGDF